MVVDQQVEQRVQVDVRLGIDRRRLLGARDLDQAEVRPIGILAHELGVHGDEGLLGEALDEGDQVFGLGDQGMDLHVSAAAIAACPRVDKRLCASEVPPRISAHRYRQNTCTPIAPTIAASSALPTSARPSACPAGSTASAIMAACCSSICAIITGSPRSSRQRAARCSNSSIRFGSESVVTITGDVVARGPEVVNTKLADRRDRGRRSRGRGPVGGGRAADAGRWRAGLSRGYPPQVPLPRPSPRAGARATSCCARR